MRTYYVEARDLPDAWFQLVDLCYKEGRDYKVGEGSYAGSQFRRELDYVTVHIRQPWQQPLLPDIPPGLGIPNPVPEGMDYVNRYLPYILTDAIEENEAYTYGQRLFGKTYLENTSSVPESLTGFTRVLDPSPSQVEEVIAKFKRGFANNQATMTIAQPSDIHLNDPPCLRQIDCRIYPAGVTGRETAVAEFTSDTSSLHFMIYFRSWDLWGGFPPNLAALVHLQEYMANEIGVAQGEFICASKGLHLYDMYFKLAEIRLGEK